MKIQTVPCRHVVGVKPRRSVPRLSPAPPSLMPWQTRQLGSRPPQIGTRGHRCLLAATPSDHAFRPRFSATPFSHVFRPRLPTYHLDRGRYAFGGTGCTTDFRCCAAKSYQLDFHLLLLGRINKVTTPNCCREMTWMFESRPRGLVGPGCCQAPCNEQRGMYPL